jgi:hypothetical protein
MLYITSNLNYFKGNYYDSTHPRSNSLPSGKNGVERDGFHQMKEEQSKYPPAKPGALRLLAPQRGLIAIGKDQ